MVFGLVDFFWRSNLWVARGFLSISLLAVIVYVGGKFLVPAIRFRRSLVDVAKALEKQNPHLCAPLSLAADFLSAEQVNGSSQLRAELVVEAEHQLSHIPVDHQVRTRAPIRAALFCGVVVMAGLVIVGLSPQDSLFALKRTATPLSTMPWPSFNQLEFVKLPPKVAAGDSFSCVVQDTNNRLPHEIALEIDDGSGTLRRPMMIERGKATFQIANVTQSIRLRAKGGDSDTGWQSVEVMQAPKVSELKIEVTPPRYTQLAPYQVSPFQKIWADSQVVICGQTDLPFDRAQFVLLGSQSAQPARRQSPQEFRFPSSQSLPVTQTIPFRVELADKEGLLGGKNRDFQIPVRVDEAPMAELTLQNRRTLYSPNDVVELQLFASDDMHIQELSLEFPPEYMGPPSTNFPLPPTQAKRATDSERDETRKNIPIQLSRFKLQPEGEEIQFFATVVDAKGQRTKSNTLTVRVGSENDLESVDLQQRSKILEQISQTLEIQTTSNNLNSLVLESADKKSGDQKPNENGALKGESGIETNLAVVSARLESISQSQRQIEEILFGSEGVIFRCEQYLKSEYAQREQQRIKEIQGIREAILKIRPAVQAATNQSGEAASVALTIDVARSYLTKTQLHQLIILKTLKSLVGNIDIETRLQGCLADLRSLLDVQRKILGDCEQANEPHAVSMQRLINEQISVSSKLNELSWGLVNDARKLGSQALQTLSEKVKRVEIHSKSAADSLKKNQTGLGIQKMGLVIEGILQILDRPTESTQPLGAGAKKSVGEALDRFSPLMTQTGEIQDQLDNWSELDTAKRKQLARSIEQFRSGLRDFREANKELLSESAQDALNAIQELLNEIADDLNDGKVQDARKKFGAVRQKMKMIGAELKAKSNEVERILRKEKFKQLQVQFLRWLELENKIKTTIEDAKTQSSVMDELVGMQQNITVEVEKCRRAHVELFALDSELKKIQENSKEIANLLVANEKEKSIAELVRILERLGKLVNQNSKEENQTSTDQDSQSNSGDSKSEDQDIRISEFETQLLRLMQEEILVETRRVESLRGQKLSPQQKADLRQASLNLADRQSDLIATLNRYLTPAKSKTPDSHQQTLPDIPEIETIPDIPDLPDCGESDGDGSLQENGSSASEDLGDNQQKTLQEKDKSKVEAVSPFDQRQLAKEGEDLGEESNTARNRLQAIKEKMVSVQEMLIRQELTKENQDIQTEIIDELNLFATDQQKKSQNRKNEKSRQKTSKKGDQSATSSDTTQNDDSNVDNNNTAEDALIQKRIDDIWGHLPEQIRRTELNIRSDQFLPKYRELIKQYFKRLAKEPILR